MKASLKFREDQKPLFRAKVPLNILGFPFQSGIVAGESKELSLNLSTFFDSGPSLKIAYRPNDSLNPFSLVFKTGIGHFGSPISSAVNMSTEFNLVGGQNPSFFVTFKPQFGDFMVKKSQSSVFKKRSKGNGGASDEDGSVMVEPPVINNNGYLLENGKKFTVSPLESPAAGLFKGVISDVEVSARTAVPLRKLAVLNFRWGMKFPAEEAEAEAEAEAVAMVKRNNPTAGISFSKLPLLVMNKIGIEHVARDNSKDSKVGPGGLTTGDVAGACLDVKRQLEVMQAENGMLRRAMDELRSEISMVNHREGERGEIRSADSKMDRSSNGNKKSSSELNGFSGKAMEVEGSEESKKALKGTNGA